MCDLSCEELTYVQSVYVADGDEWPACRVKLIDPFKEVFTGFSKQLQGTESNCCIFSLFLKKLQ